MCEDPESQRVPQRIVGQCLGAPGRSPTGTEDKEDLSGTDR